MYVSEENQSVYVIFSHISAFLLIFHTRMGHGIGADLPINQVAKIQRYSDITFLVIGKLSPSKYPEMSYIL